MLVYNHNQHPRGSQDSVKVDILTCDRIARSLFMQTGPNNVDKHMQGQICGTGVGRFRGQTQVHAVILIYLLMTSQQLNEFILSTF